MPVIVTDDNATCPSGNITDNAVSFPTTYSSGDNF
jgi:hypothetical protein